MGKTLVAAGMLSGFANLGYATVGMKPVASGCRETPAGLRSEDAETLLRYSSVTPAYRDVNPYALAPPIAPHLAAAAAGVEIRIEIIRNRFDRLVAGADVVVVEGIGGWLVPLNRDDTVAELVAALRLPVILVVGIRLGCLNHAMLTAKAIRAADLELAGWVANCIEPQVALFDANIQALRERIPAPLMGVIPHFDSDSPEKITGHLEMKHLAEILPKPTTTLSPNVAPGSGI